MMMCLWIGNLLILLAQRRLQRRLDTLLLHPLPSMSPETTVVDFPSIGLLFLKALESRLPPSPARTVESPLTT